MSVFRLFALIVLLGTIVVMAGVELFISLTPSPAYRKAKQSIKETKQWLKNQQRSQK